MLRYLYTIALYSLIPFVLCRLYWKGRRLPAYRQRIGERFALNKIAHTDVWVHAVSLGEVVAVTPIVDALLAKKLTVLITTMTPTGSMQVLTRFGSKVTHQYVPYDLPRALRRFFKKINARVGIIMETEIWPNLIYEAKRCALPLLLVNARISDKAFPKYARFKCFFKPILEKFNLILTQSANDQRRFIALGAPIACVHNIGNIKFDIQMQTPLLTRYTELKAHWGESRPVLIAASTHDDEETQLLSRLIKLKQSIPHLLLLIAPRHPERFNTAFELSQQHGFKTARCSTPELIDISTDVVVIDSLGELLGFYKIADYAFVGGSLVPVGGHNVLEPIAMQTPVFCGPFMSNSKEIIKELCEMDAIKSVANIDELIASLIDAHQNSTQCSHQVSKATTVLEINRGAVARCMQEIYALLGTN